MTDVEEAKENIRAALDCAKYESTKWYLQQAFTALDGEKEDLFRDE